MIGSSCRSTAAALSTIATSSSQEEGGEEQEEQQQEAEEAEEAEEEGEVSLATARAVVPRAAVLAAVLPVTSSALALHHGRRY
jgi:hypothetical protein